MSDFTFDTALSLYNSTEPFPVDFEDAWQWLDYSKKDKALALLEKHFVKDVDYALLQEGEWTVHGRTKDIYGLTVECFKLLGMMAGTEKGKKVRKYFLECEKELKTRNFDFGELIRQEIRDIIAPEIEQIRKYKKACDEHKGTGGVIQSDVDDKEYPIDTINIHEYCRQKGIDASLWLTISKRYGQFVRVGTKTEPPKSKGKLLVYGHLYYYADAALKSVLDID